MNGTGHYDVSEAKMVELDLQEAKDMNLYDDWKDVITATAKTCADEAEKLADRFEQGLKLEPIDPNDQICHPKYVFSLICTAKEYVMVRRKALLLI